MAVSAPFDRPSSHASPEPVEWLARQRIGSEAAKCAEKTIQSDLCVLCAICVQLFEQFGITPGDHLRQTGNRSILNLQLVSI